MSKRHTIKYMHKGVSSLTLMDGDEKTRDFSQELDVVRGLTQRIPAFYGEMRRNRDDAQELLQTVRQVAQKLDHVARQAQQPAAAAKLSKHSVVCGVITKLHEIVKQYVFLLQTELSKSPDRPLEKFMASRGRRKAEQWSSALLVETAVLAELCDDLVPPSDSLGLGEAMAADEMVDILDPDGKQMWIDNFGATTFMVDVVKVVKALISFLQLPHFSKNDRRTLLQVFDPSSTGQMSSLRFNEFLKGFGPMRACWFNLSEMLAQPWFHGFLSKSDSTKLLEVEPVNTFMVRFSSTKPGSFSLAHTMPPRDPHQGNIVNHVIIHTRENGFMVREESRDNTFASVSDLIAAYHKLLVYPYRQTFHRELWWHGDITGEEASALLEGKKAGTFLIRFSATQRGCFASSFVEKDGAIGKGLIQGQPGGYVLSAKVFSSMHELVSSLQGWEIFSDPYKNTTNEVQDEMRKNIVHEIWKTEKSYVDLLDALVNLFVREFQANPKIRPEDVSACFANVDQLLALHRPLEAALRQVYEQWDPDSALVGPLFCVLKPKMLAPYCVYVNNYNNALATVDRLMAKKEMALWLQQLMARQPGNKQNILSGLLIQPVQRGPRYILLLTDLIKHTSGPHDDYDSLFDALQMMRSCVDAINDEKRRSDELDEVQQKCALISGLQENLAVTGRSLVKEGTLGMDGKKDDYHVMVFNDLLLLTRKQGKKGYKLKDKVVLDQVQIISIPDSAISQNQFRICTMSRELTFEAESLAVKNAWIHSLKGEFSRA